MCLLYMRQRRPQPLHPLVAEFESRDNIAVALVLFTCLGGQSGGRHFLSAGKQAMAGNLTRILPLTERLDSRL